MKRRDIIVVAFAASAAAPLRVASQSADQQPVLAVVQKLFDGMRAADTVAVRSVFADGARFALIYSRATPAAIRFQSVDGWITAVGSSAKRWDEQVYDVQVRVDGNMAQVWAPYTFYLDRKVRHCGVDAIELLRDASGWRITQLSDTQRREGCRDPLGTG
jgi:hypothetical protein